MDRTLQSAMANLAGFYSEDNDKVPKFTPVPIHTIPLGKLVNRLYLISAL